MSNTPEPQQAALAPIGHYDLIECIGRGGMGLVYVARDTRLDRQVAIKCLRTELFEPHYRERFKREALLLAKLNHPHIVQIYDFVETPEQLALVMELVDGTNLQNYLREHLVPFKQRMKWLTQIAQGLALAHDAGIIHRDLKAENILINKRGDAKISDLGIAKSQDFNATLTDHVAGSYCSMSPEQAVGDELDFRSDLFSFGILAYQLLCGAHPFGDTNNKLQLMQRIISHPPISPSKVNPNLPKEISELLGQLLSKNPDNRPANTHWLAAQCEKLSQLELEGTPETDTTEILPNTAKKTTENTSNTNKTKNKITSNKNPNTQEHPTFETRFEKITPSKFQQCKKFIRTHRSASILISMLLLCITGAVIWQLQPKEPRYVAVLPPTLTTSEMAESQQELVKGAVYDAIQQSVLQLDGYYLIPQNEIADIHADNNKEGLETVRRATAADELITTDIQCKIEACTITLSRLMPDGKKQESRLRVKDTKTVDVLTDNYLSVATIVQGNISRLYLEKINNTFKELGTEDYASFLNISRLYRDSGASEKLLNDLDELQSQIKRMQAVETIYTQIALDLHHETKDILFLTKIEQLLKSNSAKKESLTYLINLFYLQVAQERYELADDTLIKIKKLNANMSLLNAMSAYKMIAKKDYNNAILFYQKSISSKKTADSLYLIAIAYWHIGDTERAMQAVNESLKLSPAFSNSLIFNGTILLLSGHPNEAIKVFNIVKLKAPNDAYNLSSLGLAHLFTKQYQKSLDFFTRANEIYPQNPAFILNKADSESLLGQHENARRSYESVIAFQEKINALKKYDILKDICQAYAHTNRFTEALATLKELEALDSQNIETIYIAALVHALAKNNTLAIFNIRSALKNGMSNIWFSLPWFDSLCIEESFIDLMKSYGEPTRCLPIPNNN